MQFSGTNTKRLTVLRTVELLLIFVVIKSMSPGVTTLVNRQSDFSQEVDTSLEMKKKSKSDIDSSKENSNSA